jgi:hypothetical protein
MHDGGADIHWHDALPQDRKVGGEPTQIVAVEQSARALRFPVLMNLDFCPRAMRNPTGLCNPAAVVPE